MGKNASLQIAKAGKPHTVGEKLCLLLAKELTHIMCGEKAAEKLNLLPLSNDKVTRIIDMADDVPEQEKLLELSSDVTLISELKQQSVLDFWIQRQNEYPALSLKAVRFLMPFAITYLCEKGFSALSAIKTKYRNKMDAEPDLSLKLTALVPNIARLCSTKQAHSFH
ncbi:ZBED5 protein, partial [Atractosteus spatula]|nr:ZBED5 protein [Atractosteus spatula]